MTGTRSFRTEEIIRSFLRVSLGLFLTLPFLIWIAEIQDWETAALGGVRRPLLNSTMQAGASTFATMAFGFVLFRGLQSFSVNSAYRWIEKILLVPNLIPPLFVGLALLSWTTVIGPFPFGMGAVVVAHVLLNSGLVAISLDRLFKSKAGGMADAAYVMGVRPYTFFVRVAWPVLRGDLMSLALFVFALGFTSFSLPLLLSGDRVVTLEIAIFDAIRTDGQWSKAVTLAALQTLFMFVLAAILPRPLWSRSDSRFAVRYLSWPLAKILVFVPMVVLLLGWSVGSFSGLGSGIEPELLASLMEGIFTSAAIGLACGLLHLILFLLTAYVSPHERLAQFLNGYLAPSAAITGFGLLLIPAQQDLSRLGVLVIALTLISYPLLYRWLVHSVLMELRKQIKVARSLGASWMMILLEVVWPQSAHTLLRASGLAALWASGDFALSGILLGDEVTVPVLINGLIANYRYDTAQLLLFPLLVVGMSLYVFFVGAARHVAR